MDDVHPIFKLGTQGTLDPSAELFLTLITNYTGSGAHIVAGKPEQTTTERRPQ